MKLFSRKKTPAESAKASPAASDAETPEPETAPEAPTTGALTVTIVPAEAVEAGAAFKVDDGEPQASGATVTDLAPGDHGVSYTPAEGFTAPPDETVAIVAGETTAIEREYAAAESAPTGEPPPAEKLTADQVDRLSAIVGPEKALAAYRSGHGIEQALADEVVTLRARIAAQEKALAESEALGSTDAVPVTAADAAPGGTGKNRDLIGEAAAATKFAK